MPRAKDYSLYLRLVFHDLHFSSSSGSILLSVKRQSIIDNGAILTGALRQNFVWSASKYVLSAWLIMLWLTSISAVSKSSIFPALSNVYGREASKMLGSLLNEDDLGINFGATLMQ